MKRLTPCSECGAHRRVDDACPSCGAAPAAANLSKAAWLLGLALVAGCGDDASDTSTMAMYGDAIMDVDGDGYSEDVDCDDDDAAVHPDADEAPGDGVDSNCDGSDDT
jgi:hypothetical protein